MICAKFCRNWPSCFEEDEDVKSLQTDRLTDRQRDGQRTGRQRTTDDPETSLEFTTLIRMI